MQPTDLFRNTDPTTGLTDSQVAQSRARFGNNLLTPPEKESLWHRLFSKFKDPLIVILLIAGALSLAIAFYEYWGLDKGNTVFFEPVGIFMAIILATGLAFFFETKADKEFSILNQISDDDPVTVIRNSQPQSVPRKDIVVGDIILISQGEEIPADALLIDTKSLNVDESTLTGEPITHKSSLPELADPDATFPTNQIMRGTKVMEGHGKARVTAVGDCTENGRVYQAAQIDNSVKTPLNEQLERLGRLISDGSYIIAGLIIISKLLLYFDWAPLAWTLVTPTATLFYLIIARFPRYKAYTCITILASFFAIFIAMVIVVANHTAAGSDLSELLAYTLQTIMIAVTLIVVAVPEGLPMAITLSLAYSMRRMLKTNNLVRKMHACETMGATTVICTDKTGTLTQNRMQVKESLFRLPDNGELPRETALAIAVNSTAQLNLKNPDSPVVLGNPTEGALLLWLRNNGFDYEQLRNSATVTEEVPFSTERKYMATVVTTPDGRRFLFIKGAPEILLRMSDNTDLDLTRQQIDDRLLEWQNKSMRTLAFACKQLQPGEQPVADNAITATGVTLQGIVAIADPVRPDVPEAIRQCMNAGIEIKIVTGDTPGTAKEIARQIGLWTSADTDRNIITGPEFGQLSDEQLAQRASEIKIIARARPLDKKRLVEALQKNGQIVAVTGDGTNDAPALKAAHVGLSMGDGTSVAKEASDITIIDNSFTSIGRAVMWGRSLYRNIQRFILFQMTVNVAACLIVLAGAFMGTESPLTVTQMLWVNLIMDTFAAMALASLPPSKSVRLHDKPRKRTDFIITPAMTRLILFTGLISFAVLFAMVYTFEHAQVNSITQLLHVRPSAPDTLSPYELSLIFTTFVFLQFWNIFNARAFATGQSAFHLHKCGEFLFIATLIFVGQILIVQFGGQFFNVTPLSLSDWITIIVGTSPILLVGEIIRIFHHKPAE